MILLYSCFISPYFLNDLFNAYPSMRGVYILGFTSWPSLTLLCLGLDIPGVYYIFLVTGMGSMTLFSFFLTEEGTLPAVLPVNDFFVGVLISSFALVYFVCDFA